MASPLTPLRGEYVPTADQRVVTYAVPWAAYEAQLALRGERGVPRIAYLEGAMELMSPSKDHERIKSFIGRLIEAYALERGIDLSPYSAWTLKSDAQRSGLEPDECYLVGDQTRDVPDLAIEVEWTSGGLDKLAIYRRLSVKEVWVWRASGIDVHVLDADGYKRPTRSELFPELDVTLLASFIDSPTVLQAVTGFREALRH
jgi:Uma2 family endonuclease